jgi:multicomponent Na+:H+ antiporter subunit F
MTAVGIICVVLLSITGVLCIVRIVRGPTMLDRTVAADVFVAASAGAIGIEAAVERHGTTLSILVVLALVGFLSSVSIARFAAPDTDRRAYDTEPTDPDETAPRQPIDDDQAGDRDDSGSRVPRSDGSGGPDQQGVAP